MRHITDHKISALNEALDVRAVELPVAGVPHAYEIVGAPVATFIEFQNGSVKTEGVNGISDEALLAIVIDRLRCFQSGSLSCRENALAITKCEEAMMWLHKRARDRIVRGVEGLNQK
jgi:hypothetical protein